MARERPKSLGYCKCLYPRVKRNLRTAVSHFRVGSITTEELVALIDQTPECDEAFLIRKLENEIDNEGKAGNKYYQLAEIAETLGYRDLDTALYSIAVQEDEHKETLTKAIKIIRVMEPQPVSDADPQLVAAFTQELHRPFPREFGDWMRLSDDLIAAGADQHEIRVLLHQIAKTGALSTPDLTQKSEDAKRALVLKAAFYGVK